MIKDLLKVFSFLIQLTVAGALVSCAQVEKYLPNDMSIHEAPGHSVNLKTRAIVKSPGQEPQEKEAGSQITVDKEPVFIEAPGYVGVLVLPPGATPATVDLELRQVSDWASDASKRYAAKRISQILDEVSQTQALIFSGQYAGALEKVRALRKDHPDITHLNFLEASVLTLLNRRAEAVALLREGLLINPDYVPAQNLLRSIASEGAP